METIGRVFVIQPYFKFKSYYVVWKLSLTTSIFSFSEGLNRTMQYGNEEYGNGIMSANKFKSYYVVWKRLHTRVSLCLSLRLNRTMQYGNEVENDKKIIREGTQFPYYIVRFKLFCLFFIFLCQSCFHTTQYDLNIRKAAAQKIGKKSFHTTQYDLN